LINPELSTEGPEFIILVKGWEKLPSVTKMIEEKVKYSDASSH